MSTSASSPRDDYFRRAEVLRVIDGDTIVVRLDLGFDVFVVQHVRLARINAPEMHGTMVGFALNAKAFLEQLIVGKTVLVQSFKTEKYGRWLGEVWSTESGRNINDVMVESGNAKNY